MPNQYLEDALDLDIHIGSMNEEVKEATDRIFHEEIETQIQTKNKPDRFKQALKTILLNLWISDRFHRPIKYSRRKNAFRRHKRYGRLFFKRDRMLPVIDALEDLGYLEQRIGYQDRKAGVRRQTRIFCTDKLRVVFRGCPENPQICKIPPSELVHLKSTDKILIDYPEKPKVRKMRSNLKAYNQFMENQNITMELREDYLETCSEEFIEALKGAILKGQIEPVRPVSIKDLLSMGYYLKDKLRDIYGYLIGLHHPIPPHITGPNFSRCPDIKGSQAETFSDKQQGKIVFKVNYPYLHRVFNEGSFFKGGRFYGAFHLNMPKPIRSTILLNNSRTVELDFEALHIRMLYHMEGIDCRADPYSALCSDPTERKLFKSLALIAINAPDEALTIKAMRDIMNRKKSPVKGTDENIRGLLDRFRSIHGPISKYLCTGIGMKLQNKDSKITDTILSTLTEEEIPCLPEHDSLIVPEIHQNRLHELMMDVYETHMGFKPVVG